jgi:hypothetical protein
LQILKKNIERKKTDIEIHITPDNLFEFESKNYVKHQLYFNGIKILTLYKNDTLQYRFLESHGKIKIICDKCEFQGYDEDGIIGAENEHAYWGFCDYCNINRHLLCYTDNPISNAVRAYCSELYGIEIENSAPYDIVRKTSAKGLTLYIDGYPALNLGKQDLPHYFRDKTITTAHEVIVKIKGNYLIIYREKHDPSRNVSKIKFDLSNDYHKGLVMNILNVVYEHKLIYDNEQFIFAHN